MKNCDIRYSNIKSFPTPRIPYRESWLKVLSNSTAVTVSASDSHPIA